MRRPRTRLVRIATQGIFLLAFLALFWGLAEPRVPATVASILLALDPLTAVGTALSDWTIVGWTWLGLVVLGLTAIFGRFFCGWICPLGTLQQMVSWVAGPERRKRYKINRYRPWFSVKYIVLTVVLVWAALGTIHIGWLDPIPLLHRAFAAGIRPLWHGGLSPGGWVSFGLLATILLLAAAIPRFFCRAVCPLGALLGVFSRLAPLRIRRDDTASCTGCTLCVFACQGADEPLEKHRVSECHVCLNCLGSCSEESLRYGPVAPGPKTPMPTLGVGRRRFLLTIAGSAAFAPVLRAAGNGMDGRTHDAIRPPGALDEESFLARCITCGACSASCPTGVIRADLGKTGIEGLFTPILDMRRGWCEPSCIRCGEVCPTEAIATLDPDTKQASGGPADVAIGTAVVDRGRGLPWGMETPCIVCEEMCPTSPKAVWLETMEITNRAGQTITLQRPSVQPDLCTGCGLCENRCPVGEEAAIRISSVGETRDPQNQMLQQRSDV
ncbi:MAG: 4Fe-4S binding protein [Acidobacteriota bacterium]|nr:4Fe-4S binding protein [Acidobacteriota bacterium]